MIGWAGGEPGWGVEHEVIPMTTRVGSRALAAVAAALLVAGCTNVLDEAKAESTIRDGLATQLGAPVAKVDCPADRAAKTGDVFECTAKTEDGQELAIKVTQKDDQGNLEWELTTELLNMAGLVPALEDWLPQQGVTPTAIDCPKARVMKKGDTFDCTVTADDGRTLAVTVTQDDDQGNVSWELSGS